MATDCCARAQLKRFERVRAIYARREAQPQPRATFNRRWPTDPLDPLALLVEQWNASCIVRQGDSELERPVEKRCAFVPDISIACIQRECVVTCAHCSKSARSPHIYIYISSVYINMCNSIHNCYGWLRLLLSRITIHTYPVALLVAARPVETNNSNCRSTATVDNHKHTQTHTHLPTSIQQGLLRCISASLYIQI